MHKERKEKHFIQKPSYDGGPKAMTKFIYDNLKYPKEALEEKIEGTVRVRYTINHLGEVVDAKIQSSLGYGCDEEAIRVIKLLKFQVPKNRGIRAQFHKNANIRFKLPKQKPAPKPSTSVQYQYTTTKKESDATPTKKKEEGGGYRYTIKF